MNLIDNISIKNSFLLVFIVFIKNLLIISFYSILRFSFMIKVIYKHSPLVSDSALKINVNILIFSNFNYICFGKKEKNYQKKV
jgi:hypothetical protein